MQNVNDKEVKINRIIEKIKHPTKRQFLTAFFVIVAILGVIRYFVQRAQRIEDAPIVQSGQKYHPIRGVHNYKTEFPDSQSVQITAAQKWGV